MSGRTNAGAARVALLGWAWLPLQAGEGTGYNLVASELGAGLAREGHRVLYLRSGVTYSLRPRPRIYACETWRGVECFDLANSPNLATADRNFRNVREQIASPAHTALVVRFLREHRVDLAHIHSFEGYGFDLPAALRDAGIRCVVTPHNSYALCPQVDLMHAERETCLDYDGGRRCVGCIPSPNPSRDRLRRTVEQTADRRLGHEGAACVRAMLSHPAPVPGPGRVVPLPVSSADITQRLLEGNRHREVANIYGERRDAGIAALNASDLVLCPGSTLLRLHRAMGVEAAKLRHTPIGLPHIDDLSNVPAAPAWTPSAPGPLRLLYLGSTKPNKGLATLIGAIRAFPADALVRVEITVRASGDDSPFRDAARGLPITFAGPYATQDLPRLLTSHDVGLFPNLGIENCPLVLLEYLASGRFVVGSRLGASLDWIDEPRNGILAPAGDTRALAHAIGTIVRGDQRLPAGDDIRAVRRPPSFAAFLAGVRLAYADVLGTSSPAITGRI